MHELSVASAVLNTALRHADDRPVALVAVQVGALRQVVADSLRFYWEIVARDTVCEGAQLKLTEVAARLRCETCSHEWAPRIADFRCRRCASADVTVIAGEQLEVDYLELAEEALHA